MGSTGEGEEEEVVEVEVEVLRFLGTGSAIAMGWDSILLYIFEMYLVIFTSTGY